MTRYCENKSKATISFSLNGRQQRIEVEPCPVDVEITQESTATDGVWSTIKYAYTLEGQEYIDVVSAWGAIEGIRESEGSIQLLCRGRDFPSGPNPSPFWEFVTTISTAFIQLNPRIISIIRDDGQLVNDQQIITIKDINGNILYQKSGKVENLQVGCDEGCPDGYIKCEASVYPGYCCISCSEIKTGIASATAMVRSINRG